MTATNKNSTVGKGYAKHSTELDDIKQIRAEEVELALTRLAVRELFATQYKYLTLFV